jgi:arylformamidase
VVVAARVREVLAAVVVMMLFTSCGLRGDSDDPNIPRCQDQPSGPFETTYGSARGVDTEELSLDVYLPVGCGPFPTIVWVHGGGWLAGDKRNDVVLSKIALVRNLGVALVAINYRLSDPTSEVPWPHNAQDVADAIAWIEDSGARYNLDPTNLSAIGHSAGAHLVAIVATDPQFLDEAGTSESALACVVALDSTAYNMIAASNIEQILIYRAFGTDIRAIREASPLVAVREFGAPPADFLVVARGTPTRVAAQQQFVDEIVAAGGRATLIDVNPYDHSDAGWQLGVPGEQVLTPAVEEFLLSCQTSAESR